MGIPYRSRVNEHWFLDLPDYHGTSCVVAYVEDTTDRGLRDDPYCDDDCACCPPNFEPRVKLEIADNGQRVNLAFDVDCEEGRASSLHKLETLIVALQVFRAALVEEVKLYEFREREIAELHDE